VTEDNAVSTTVRKQPIPKSALKFQGHETKQTIPISRNGSFNGIRYPKLRKLLIYVLDGDLNNTDPG
jgi:hypothetical protein